MARIKNCSSSKRKRDGSSDSEGREGQPSTVRTRTLKAKTLAKPELDAGEALVNKIIDLDKSKEFRNCIKKSSFVTPEEYNRYHTLFQEMSLGKVINKKTAGEYTCLRELAYDVKLTFHNAIRWNDEASDTSHIGVFAMELLELFETELAELCKRLKLSVEPLTTATAVAAPALAAAATAASAPAAAADFTRATAVTAPYASHTAGSSATASSANDDDSTSSEDDNDVFPFSRSAKKVRHADNNTAAEASEDDRANLVPKTPFNRTKAPQRAPFSFLDVGTLGADEASGSSKAEHNAAINDTAASPLRTDTNSSSVMATQEDDHNAEQMLELEAPQTQVVEVPAEQHQHQQQQHRQQQQQQQQQSTISEAEAAELKYLQCLRYSLQVCARSTDASDTAEIKCMDMSVYISMYRKLFPAPQTAVPSADEHVELALQRAAMQRVTAALGAAADAQTKLNAALEVLN